MAYKVEKSETIDGLQYTLSVDDGDRGKIVLRDVEADEIVATRLYPKAADARAAYTKAVSIEKRSTATVVEEAAGTRNRTCAR